MVLDATANGNAAVTRDRLLGWHAARFPTGYSGLVRINVALKWMSSTSALNVPDRPTR